MLESIEIKNFRCFKETKVSQFGLVNLFGGLNNSGKTTLLEAIVLIKSPYHEAVVNLLAFRGESLQFIKEKPESAWDNFFYQQNISNSIEINTIDNELGIRKIVLTCDDNINELIDSAYQESNKDVINYIEISYYFKKVCFAYCRRKYEGEIFLYFNCK